VLKTLYCSFRAIDAVSSVSAPERNACKMSYESWIILSSIYSQ